MVVLILEKVPRSLRGEITRWMIEPKAGVFVGNLSALVRGYLWRKVCEKSNGGGCILLHGTNNEQGFDVEFWGATKRRIVNWEGLKLVTHPRKKEDASAPPTGSASVSLAHHPSSEDDDILPEPDSGKSSAETDLVF
ncbi:MAG: type I-E CRISPR-associated endoribonuclease Cas2e [Candidatus Sumerlaeota bacterium]|nr:type I-E CRISPR-associated endoribonuclease Cas2e [Candidatus Sumerlaeota bacterium]